MFRVAQFLSKLGKMAFGQKTLHQQMEGHKIYEANV
jgi:hypothetical protein